MPFVAAHPERYVGQVVGEGRHRGQCVSYVRTVTKLPQTSLWIEGAPVWDCDSLALGTAVACFDANGCYGNNTDGSSHAAIFIEHDPTTGGFWAYDQWVGHPVSRRLIRAKGGAGQAVDDADAYAVIEVAA
jgi:hypothetical protein